MGELRYCFEEDHVKATLARSKPSDLAVIDSDGIPKSVIQAAVARGVLVYDYINCGALEKGRSQREAPATIVNLTEALNTLATSTGGN